MISQKVQFALRFQAARETRDLAYNTVSLTYGMHQIVAVIPKTKLAKERREELDNLAVQLKSKGFVIAEHLAFNKKFLALRNSGK